MSKRKKYVKSCEVSQLITPELGGYKQKVLIDGKRKDLPVVICLHGGPGTPAPFSVGCRGLFPEWTDKAVMVYWDQLGCGANNYNLDESFHIPSFVDMTCDLVAEIKKLFPENRLYLFGVSWGSLLALNAAVRFPDQIDGVLIYGQVIKNLFFNDEVASAFTKPKIRATVQKIIQTGTDCEYKVLDGNLKKLNKLLNKYTNAYTNKNSKPASLGKIIMGLLTSPDYSFKDFRAVVKNGYSKNTTLWRELLNIDLTPLFSEVQIQYHILQGDTDIVTSTRSVAKAVESCGNKNVTLTVIKNSGHMPSADAMYECFKAISKLVE